MYNDFMNRAAFLGLAFFFAAGAAHAQALGAEPLTLTLSPQYPGPYQTVTVTPVSNLIDLSRSTVTISVDGKVIHTGTGTESASFTTGGPGTSNTVTVSVASPDGIFTQSATVRPSSVALIEEPMSTTHPFYDGAAQVAAKGEVRLIAMADLRTSAGAAPISPDKLVYTWRIGDQLMQDNSGIGKSVFTVVAPDQYRDAQISLTVSTQDGSLAGSASVTLAPVSPILLFYKDGPLLGPGFDSAVPGTFTMEGSEESFRAVPYFFASAPALAWSVNGVESAHDPVITLRPTGEGQGTAALSATASASGTFVSASQQTTIRFGQAASTGIFGL
jgi:hypothetical protein